MALPPSELTVVVGLARSGAGVARLLHRQEQIQQSQIQQNQHTRDQGSQSQGSPDQDRPARPGSSLLVIDSAEGEEQRRRAEALRAEGIAVRLGVPLTEAALEELGPVGTVVVSPGIRWDHPTLEALRRRGISVLGDLVPAWRASRPLPWIGITGTNGKTTVTHLVSHLLSQAGLQAPMGGNVGVAAAELVLEHCLPRESGVSPPGPSLAGMSPEPGMSPEGSSPAPRPDWLVMEMSSYQIEAAAEICPRIGLWTTLTPDHLERHGTLEAYRAIKRSLLERSSVRILNADDPDLRAHAPSWQQPVCWVTAGPRQALPAMLDPLLWIEADQVWQRTASGPRPLLAADCLAMPGAHNRQNLVLAVAAGLEAGLSGDQMEAALRCFPGVPHRLERLGERNGLTWYNDSKATNYDAAVVALQALEGPLLVLAGGEAKQGDPAAWLAALQRTSAAVVLFGAARTRFAGLLEQAGYGGQVRQCEGLAEAVPLAAALGRSLGCRAVLLSPACASFDQYPNFEARGDHFRQLVQALPACT